MSDQRATGGPEVPSDGPAGLDLEQTMPVPPVRPGPHPDPAGPDPADRTQPDPAQPDEIQPDLAQPDEIQPDQVRAGPGASGWVPDAPAVDDEPTVVRPGPVAGLSAPPVERAVERPGIEADGPTVRLTGLPDVGESTVRLPVAPVVAPTTTGSASRPAAEAVP